MSGNKRKNRSGSQPRIVYYVRWSLSISIEISDGAFQDYYECERQKQEDMFRYQSEEQDSGVSSNAYGDINEANKAAKEKFEEVQKKYLDKYLGTQKYNPETEDSGDDEEDYDDVLSVSDFRFHQDTRGEMCWNWDFYTYDSYENILIHGGHVHLTPIRVIEHDGIVYKESDTNIL